MAGGGIKSDLQGDSKAGAMTRVPEGEVFLGGGYWQQETHEEPEDYWCRCADCGVPIPEDWSSWCWDCLHPRAEESWD